MHKGVNYFTYCANKDLNKSVHKALGLQIVKPNPCMPHLQAELSNICSFQALWGVAYDIWASGKTAAGDIHCLELNVFWVR